jgi:hypothetical protein
MAEDFERLEIRGEDDPVLMDGEAGDENGQVKIKAGETGEAERDTQQAKSFHARISDAARDCHIISCSRRPVDGAAEGQKMRWRCDGASHSEAAPGVLESRCG